MCKHVLCEKPLALSGRDVDAMIAASQKAGRKLMCAQHMRFEPEAIALKEYIRKHPLGQIYYARAWYNRRRGLPTTKGFLLNSNSGGGCCIDVGVHVLDLAMHLMDNFEPVCVAGIAVTIDNHRCFRSEHHLHVGKIVVEILIGQIQRARHMSLGKLLRGS